MATLTLQERTPGERAAYLEGYSAALTIASAAIAAISDATTKAALEMKSDADVVVLLARMPLRPEGK